MILWLLPSGENMSKVQQVIRSEAHRLGLAAREIMFAQPRNHRLFSGMWEKPAGGEKYKFDDLSIVPFFKWFDHEVKRIKPKVIVVNDPGLLKPFTDDAPQTLVTHRGMVYHYAGIPVIVVDNVNKTYNEYLSQDCAVDLWIFRQDLGKIVRFHSDKHNKTPRFSHVGCSTLEGVRAAVDFIRANLSAIGCDIETTSGWISSLGMGGCDKDGKFHGFTFEFATPDGNQWNADDEYKVWLMLQEVFGDENITKIFHNGNYDIPYLMRLGVVMRGGLVDTMILWHAIWASTPKSLDFCASITMDEISYWKDEVKEERDSTAKYAVPVTRTGIQRYYQYNCIDIYATYFVAMRLVKVVTHPKFAWALRNYQAAMLNQFGPAMMMQVIGLKVKGSQRQKLLDGYKKEADAALAVLHEICGPNFNPLSDQQTRRLMYDILGDARPVRRGAPSVSAKIMDRVAEIAPLHGYLWNLIKAYKKPIKNISMYGDGLKLSPDSRYHFSLSTTATWTARYGSRSNPFSYGGNSQNMPKKMRPMCVVDDGYVFLDADYGQSDLWFVAYESGDENLIKVLNSGIDVHSYHVDKLLGVPYDQVVSWRKLKETSGDPDWAKKVDFIENPITGVRQIIKKVVHGTNYVMGPMTMFANIGRPALVAAALASGYKDALGWTNDQCVQFCRALQERYFKLYPGVARWRVSVIGKCHANGLLATVYGGRTHLFFNAPGTSGGAATAAHRALVSFYGQGGTSGNINRALEKIYWQSDLMDQGVILYNQVHDNILSGIPLTKLHLADNVLDIMQSQVELNGQKFKVPIEAEFSFVWADKANVPWQPGMDYEKLKSDLIELRHKQLGV